MDEKPEYLVKWAEYDEKTWEPIESLKACPTLLCIYEQEITQTLSTLTPPKPTQKSPPNKKIHTTHKIKKMHKATKKTSFVLEEIIPLFSDEIEKIISVVKGKCTKKFKYQVQWKPRKDGIRPMNSVLKGKIIRRICPTLALDYYEARVT